MKNLETLSVQEARSFNGGCQMDPCPTPYGGPIIVIGPDFPIPPYGDPRDQDNHFPF